VTGHVLRLCEDVVRAGASVELGAVNRVMYVVTGDVVVGSGGAQTSVKAGAAWFGAGTVVVTAGAGGARVWRWELGRGFEDGPGRMALEHPIELDRAGLYVMRADRVEFELGGVALPHGHRGGGIRCLLAGELEVTVGEGAPRVMKVGDAWFESGGEPVLAKASRDVATSFIRVSVLPREIRGRSSIVYVDPADAARAKPRTYTVYVDEPIEIV
jgi:quercetin dioxygenase-like cupin family protein